MEPINTSPTLLQRVKNTDDHDAWHRFYEMYSPLIIGFALQRGCSEAMAHDVLQETMCRLIRFLPKFQYDRGPEDKRRFRSYLFTVVKSRISSVYKSTLKGVPLCENSGSPPIDIPDDGQALPGDAVDELWKKYVMFLAIERVKERVDESTWASFEMYVLDRKNADDVADTLHISRNLVYQHKNSVTKLLTSEVARIKAEIGEEG